MHQIKLNRTVNSATISFPCLCKSYRKYTPILQVEPLVNPLHKIKWKITPPLHHPLLIQSDDLQYLLIGSYIILHL